MIKNKHSIVFIPHYFIPLLEANGMSLDTLDKLVFDTNNSKDISKKLNDISKYDLSTLYILNAGIRKRLNMNTYPLHGLAAYIDESLYGEIYPYVHNERNEALVNAFNTLRDTDSILVSDNKNAYSFDARDNTLFVILHSGFENTVAPTSQSLRRAFVKDLTNKMFTAYGETIASNSNVISAVIANQAPIINSARR